MMAGSARTIAPIAPKSWHAVIGANSATSSGGGGAGASQDAVCTGTGGPQELGLLSGALAFDIFDDKVDLTTPI